MGGGGSSEGNGPWGEFLGKIFAGEFSFLLRSSFERTTGRLVNKWSISIFMLVPEVELVHGI